MHREFIRLIESGYSEESYVEQYLLKNVLDQGQKDFLRNNDLTYSIIANGRYECIGNIEQLVEDWKQSVNDSLGYELFIA